MLIERRTQSDFLNTALAAPGQEVAAVMLSEDKRDVAGEPTEGSGPSLTAGEERRRRRMHLWGLGILLLASSFWNGFMVLLFRGFEMRLAESAPVLACTLIGYPAFAGIVVLLLSRSDHGRIRGIVLTLLWAAPAAVLIDDGVRRTLAEVLPTGASVMTVLAPGLMVLGSMGLFAGSLSRRCRPASRASFVVGVAGALLYVAGLALFVGAELSGGNVLASALRRMSGRDLTWPALAVLGQVLLLLAASVLVFANGPRRSAPAARQRGAHAFALVVLAFVLGTLTLFPAAMNGMTMAVSHLEPYLSSNRIAVGLFALPKFLAWCVGVPLLPRFGLADLIVGRGSARDSLREDHATGATGG